VWKRRNAVRELIHRPRKVARDARRLVFGAPEERHDQEHVGAINEKVYQEVLVDSVDLSQQAPDACSGYSAGYAASGRKPNLHRHIVTDLLGCRRAKEQAHAACGDGMNVVAAPVEERLDEAFPLQSVRTRKRQAAGRCSVSHGQGQMVQRGSKKPCYTGLPLSVSLTVRFLRPFLRRRFRISRPLLVFMRARKPCLFFRFFLLG